MEKGKDLQNKLDELIREEIQFVLNEREYKYGGLLDPKNFDPVDPDIHIAGYGTMTRSALRREIAKRLEGAAKTAKTAAAGGPGSFRMYSNLVADLEDKNVLALFINAEVEVAKQLEELRTKGGRRSIPIPKQF
jgi:hypothetical protein